MNKDFYEELPGMVCAILDDLIEKYGDKQWFNQAWEEYRQHIKDNSMDDMKMPGYVFNKYIDNKKQQELKMNKEYALYKGDELLDIGTLDYLSKKFNIKRKSLLFYQSPTYRKRTSEKKGRRLVRC